MCTTRALGCVRLFGVTGIRMFMIIIIIYVIIIIVIYEHEGRPTVGVFSACLMKVHHPLQEMLHPHIVVYIYDIFQVWRHVEHGKQCY